MAPSNSSILAYNFEEGFSPIEYEEPKATLESYFILSNASDPICEIDSFSLYSDANLTTPFSDPDLKIQGNKLKIDTSKAVQQTVYLKAVTTGLVESSRQITIETCGLETIAAT